MQFHVGQKNDVGLNVNRIQTKREEHKGREEMASGKTLVLSINVNMMESVQNPCNQSVVVETPVILQPKQRPHPIGPIG